jgi:hypothetical protein
MTPDDKNAAAREQAKAQLASIIEMVEALECDYDRLEELKDLDEAELTEDEKEELKELQEAAGDCESQDDARQRIEDDALSVEVRGDWHYPGDSDGGTPTEFKILLCTGGPACQIIGGLDQHNQPESVRLMFQDWLTSWEELILTSEECDAVLTYCQVFYFGE